MADSIPPSTPSATGESTPAPDVCELVGLFTDPHAMEMAVQELLTSGFDHGDLSILADERTVRGALGHRLVDTVAAADDPQVPRRAWIEPESRVEGRSALAAALGYVGAVTAAALTFATGGVAAAAIGGAVVGAGTGAGLGAVLGRLFDQHLAREFETQIERGGILTWVRCRATDADQHATEILQRHGAHHVHLHAPPRQP